MIPEYNTLLMGEIWPEASKFVNDYVDCELYLDKSKISVSSAYALYYLLCARYRNNPIANNDELQFKYKVFSIIFQYGPTWEKRLDIQNKLRNLSEDEIRNGTFAMYNTALNPSDTVNDTSAEIHTLNNQNTTRYTKSHLESYELLWEMLRVDVSEEFIKRFSVCFKPIVRPERVVLFANKINEEDDDGND